MVQLGGKYQEGLPIAAEYNGLEEISRGQEHLQAHYQRGLGPMWAVMVLKMRKLFFMSHKLCIPTDHIILSNFITSSSFFNFQLNQAFALPAQVSNVCQPFYFQSTSVNCHCHFSDTQHNVKELNTDTIFKKRSNTYHIPSQLCYSHHGH